MAGNERQRRLADFLRNQRMWLCNSCISRLMGTTRRHSDLTRLLSSARRYFVLEEEECAECGERRRCIKALICDSKDVTLQSVLSDSVATVRRTLGRVFERNSTAVGSKGDH
jgi:hypothetical protein